MSAMLCEQEDESPLDHMDVEVVTETSSAFISHPSDFVIECQTIDIEESNKDDGNYTNKMSEAALNGQAVDEQAWETSATASEGDDEIIHSSVEKSPEIVSPTLSSSLIINCQPWEIVTVTDEHRENGRNEIVISDPTDAHLVCQTDLINGTILKKTEHNVEIIRNNCAENDILSQPAFQSKLGNSPSFQESPARNKGIDNELNDMLRGISNDTSVKQDVKRRGRGRPSLSIQRKINGIKKLTNKARFVKSHIRNRINNHEMFNSQEIVNGEINEITEHCPNNKCPSESSSATEIVSGNESTERDLPLPVNYRYIITKVTKDETSILNWCNKVGLIPVEVYCECGTLKEIQIAKDKPLGLIRKCPQCKLRTSVLKGTWFESSHLSIAQIIELTYMWIYKLPQTYVQHELSTSSHHTTGDWYMYCREVCAVILQKTSEKLGGKGKIVELGETKIGKKKFNKGRLLDGQWILGGIERDSRRMFVASVKEKNIGTFISILKEWVYPGTTIIAECAKSYPVQGDERLKRFAAKHKINFIDPFTSTHGQSMNNRWKQRDVPDSRKEFPNTYFLEYMYRVKYNTSDDLFLTFVSHLSKVYPGK